MMIATTMPTSIFHIMEHAKVIIISPRSVHDCILNVNFQSNIVLVDKEFNALPVISYIMRGLGDQGKRDQKNARY